jgi:DNA-binding CsgD family transcriptional regulator
MWEEFGMPEARRHMSARSLAVLEMIAAGSTYEQILSTYPDLGYLDIFRAAEEALAMAVDGRGLHRSVSTMAQQREHYPRAYEKWTDAEDAELQRFVQSGMTVAQIAGRLQRNRGAIRSRLMKLNLVAELSPKEQERLRRIVERDGIRLGRGTSA